MANKCCYKKDDLPIPLHINISLYVAKVHTCEQNKIIWSNWIKSNQWNQINLHFNTSVNYSQAIKRTQSTGIEA